MLNTWSPAYETDIRNRPRADEALDKTESWLDLPVSTVMLADPVTIDVRATVREAQAMMSQASVGHLPVLASGRAVGMLTARDLARAAPVPLTVLESRELERLLAVPVGLIMSTPVQTLPATARVRDALDRLVNQNLGSVVILDGDEGDAPIGLITRSTLLALVAQVAS